MEDPKNRILQAANELYLRYGIRSVSLDDIARHLGMSKKTIYQSFADKDELVHSVSRLHLKMWEQRLSEIFTSAGDSIEALMGYTQVLREQFAEMNPTIMFDLFKFHRKAWEELAAFKQTVVKEHLRSTLHRGMADGFFRDNLDVEILAALRLEEVEMGFNDNVFPHAQYSLEKVQLQLFDHFIHGLLTDLGRARYDAVRLNHKITTKPS